MSDALPIWQLPQEASRSLAALALRHYVEWEVGLGDGAVLGRDGRPERGPDGRVLAIAADRSQNDLQGEHRVWKRCDAGFPVLSGGAIVAEATFGPDEANFDILEQGLRAKDPTTGTVVMFARGPGDQGTKRGGTWRACVELVL